jgi:heat shock protein HspQ
VPDESETPLRNPQVEVVFARSPSGRYVKRSNVMN